MKKCVKCGAPLEGFFAKIASLAGVKPSAVNSEVCNKCESLPLPEQPSNVAPEPMAENVPEQTSSEPLEKPTEPIAPVMTDLPADARPEELPIVDAPAPSESVTDASKDDLAV